MYPPTHTPPNIPIVQTLFGEALTNSVDARYVHSELGVSKDFTDWIKAQIRRADLEEGKDYIAFVSRKNETKEVFPQKGVNPKGGRPTTQYILTTEAAKHIAMMSQSKKAKEIRDYFIAVERQYITQLRQGSALVSFDAEASRQLESMRRHVKSMQEDLTAIKEQFVEDARERAEIRLQQMQNTIHTDRLATALENLPMDSEQISLLRQMAEARGREIALAAGVKADVGISTIFREINRHFSVRTYYEIDRADFQTAVNFIGTVTL